MVKLVSVGSVINRPQPCLRQVEQILLYTHLLSRDFSGEVHGELTMDAAASPLAGKAHGSALACMESLSQVTWLAGREGGGNEEDAATFPSHLDGRTARTIFLQSS